jgi:hypothetical protein
MSRSWSVNPCTTPSARVSTQQRQSVVAPLSSLACSAGGMSRILLSVFGGSRGLFSSAPERYNGVLSLGREPMRKMLVLSGMLVFFAAVPFQAASATQQTGWRAEKRVACINATKYTVSDKGRGWRSRFRACMFDRWV